MINIVICDDEEECLKEIENQIEKYLSHKNILDFKINTFKSGMELCRQIEKFDEYQVFFLDINMSEINGLDVARMIRDRNEKALIVFITAYIDYAVDGYKVEAIRFIIKDMLEQMLPECMDTVLQKLSMSFQKIELPFQEGKREVLISNIVYVESNRHKVFFHIKQKDTTMDQLFLYDKLDNIQNSLEDYGFLRIHKSYLVNMQYIEDIVKYKVMLKTGVELSIPRAKYNLVEEEYYVNVGKML